MLQSKLLKGNLQTIVLKLLQDNGKMYGYEIVQKVRAITLNELQITEGALYPTLHKLEAAGLLAIEWVKVDNRMRKYYQLTEGGKVETKQRLKDLMDYLQTLQKVLNTQLTPEML